MSPLPTLSAIIPVDDSSFLHIRNITNATDNGLEVVCAWPLSSQYGPGSRFLYYTLIATCVLARKAEWIKNACLAAALLVPSMAAAHGIVLASLHVDGAVDMDIFGAFQLCAIGILAAPVTVRLSKTYLYELGRNVIFLWAGLILAGLISLTVEFYRTETVRCRNDESGTYVPPEVGRFPYGEDTTCGMTCSVEKGPFSPMRGGPNSNIYVIPAPDILTVGTATLLSAACCVQAILWLVSMLDKILDMRWKLQSGEAHGQVGQASDEPIEGTNGATKDSMKGVNARVKFFLNMAVVPVFGGVLLAILIIGERNFFSPQIRYQNEPMASVGQWGSIVGVGLGLLGSLYLTLAADMEAVEQQEENAGRDADDGQCQCSCTHHIRRSPSARPRSRRTESNDSQDQPPIHPTASATDDIGKSRRAVAGLLLAAGNFLGDKVHKHRRDSSFRRGSVLNFPEIPGEFFRSSELPRIKEVYDPPRDPDGNVSPGPRSSSGGASPMAGSSGSVRPPNCATSNGSSSSRTRQRSSTVPTQPPMQELKPITSLPATAAETYNRGRPRFKATTLEVPLQSQFRLSLRRSQSPDVSPTTKSGNRRASPPPETPPPVIRVVDDKSVNSEQH